MTEDPYGATRFAADTTNHQLTVLHDDGLYRHLRFTAPEGGFYWFDLVTWPGKLAVVGGFGDGYVFSRVEDMFTFFRTPTLVDDNPNGINPGYWAEKVVDGRERCSAYSEKKFRAQVAEDFADCEDQFPGLGAAISEAMDDDYATYLKEGAQEFLRDFTYTTDDGQKRIAEARAEWSSVCGTGASTAELDAAWAKYQQIERGATFGFHDWPEWDLTDYAWQYLWACNAIAWGVKQYDEAKRPAEVTA